MWFSRVLKTYAIFIMGFNVYLFFGLSEITITDFSIKTNNENVVGTFSKWITPTCSRSKSCKCVSCVLSSKEHVFSSLLKLALLHRLSLAQWCEQNINESDFFTKIGVISERRHLGLILNVTCLLSSSAFVFIAPKNKQIVTLSVCW